MCAWIRAMGEPKKPSNYIFNNGQFYVGNGLNYTTNAPTGYTQYAGGAIAHSIVNDKLVLTNSTDTTFPTAFTTLKIDVTDYNSIIIDVDSVTVGAANCYIWSSVSATNTNGYANATNRLDIRTSGQYTIDVSALTGEYYFYICLGHWIATTTITINSIELV